LKIRIVILAIIFLSLFALTSPFNIQRVSGQEAIYIKADGSIDPSTAPLQKNGNIYTLNSDIYGFLVIEKDNITIDGQNFTLQGKSEFESKGVTLLGRTNVTIKNLQIREFYYGIWLRYSHNNKLIKNTMTENTGRSFWLGYSSNNTITNNNISKNKGRGILLDHSPNNIIANNEIINGGCDALVVSHSNDNLIFENTIAENNGNGIWLGYSNSSKIYGNNIISNNYNGLSLYFSKNNTIYGNTISNSNVNGINLKHSNHNTIFNNNFVNNHIQIYLESSNETVWNISYPFGGNFWSHFNGTDFYHGPSQNNTGSDGISDKQYFIEENHVDKYPLMGIFRRFNILFDFNVDVVSNYTIENVRFFQANATITMSLSSNTINQTFGFCKVTISHELITPKYIVKINNIDANYTTLFENETLSIIYFKYYDLKPTITILPEFQLNIVNSILLVLISTCTLLTCTRKGRNKNQSSLIQCNTRMCQVSSAPCMPAH